MTDIIIHKHSITASDVPAASEIDLGELAIQAADGHIYLKKTDGTINRVTMLPGGTQQQVLYKTGAGDYALGWGTISSTLIGGTLWSEVVAEVQRVFELVEGTASVLLSAPATLTAGSTGPLTVSVADASYLTDGTNITGVLGTVYGTLSRSGSTYSFVSNQSYTSGVNFATGTRFAAAFLNNSFNPLTIGNAEVTDDNTYEEGSGYVYAIVDSNNRLVAGIKSDGTFNLLSGELKLNQALIENDESYSQGSGYESAFVDKNGKIAFGIAPDGSVKGLSLKDNLLKLNKGETGSGVTAGESGVEVDRGLLPNAKFVWVETSQNWEAGDPIKTPKLLLGTASSEDVPVFSSSGYAWAVTDLLGKLAFGLKQDGTLAVSKIEVDGNDLSASGGDSEFNTDITQGDFLIRAISPTGNDLDDGSIGKPWATLSKLKTWVSGLPNPSKIKLLIKSGSYSENTANPLYFQTSGLYSEVYFEEGVSITLNQSGGTSLGNGVGADRGVHYFYLNAATITLNAADTFPTISDNGLGVHGGRTYVYGANKQGGKSVFVGFMDGTSNHNSGYLEANDCVFRQCPKGAFTHVNTSTSIHRRCEFEGLVGSVYGVGDIQQSASAEFVECKILPDPAATAPQTAGVLNAKLERCQIGTLTQSVALEAVNSTVTDSYLNLVQNREHGNTTYRRCYGFYTNENQSGNANESRFLSCVFVGPGSFASSSRWFISGVSFGKFYIFNSIITGYGQVIDVGGNATRIAAVNNWVMDGLCLFNNTTNFDSGINNPAILVSSDPLLGAANTLVQGDYEIGMGSPCRYTGLNSNSIGLPDETP